MSLNLPRVYPITDTRLAGLSHAEQVKRLIAGGATLIQLRDKHATPRDFYREAATALRLARYHNARLIINDRVDIALALGADGVHLGQSDIPARAARRLLGSAAIIGVSTHNPTQVALAIEMPVDYVAFGPIFRTETKKDPDALTGLEGLRSVRSLIDMPLVAIGGITLTNAAGVFEAGADAVATIAGLVGDPTRTSEKMRRMLVEALD